MPAAKKTTSGRMTPGELRELLPVLREMRDAGVSAVRLGGDGSIELALGPSAGSTVAVRLEKPEGTELDPDADFDSADG